MEDGRWLTKRVKHAAWPMWHWRERLTELAEFDVLTAINRSQTGLSWMVTRFLHFPSRIIFFNAKNACCFGVHFWKRKSWSKEVSSEGIRWIQWIQGSIFCVFVFSSLRSAWLALPASLRGHFSLCLIRFLTSQLLLRVFAYISCFKEAAASLVTRLVLEALDWNSINGGWRFGVLLSLFADCDMEVIWSAVSFDVVWVVPLWLSWTRCETCCQSGEACQRTQGERSKVRRIRHGQSNKSIPLDW